MGKVISVATQYAMYEVEDNVFEMLTTGTLQQPPQIVLELMTFNGQAKKIGNVSTLTINAEEFFPENEEGEDEEPPEGAGPWLEED